jgi:hypothetical protein
MQRTLNFYEFREACNCMKLRNLWISGSAVGVNLSKIARVDPTRHGTVRFGQFELDTGTEELRKSGEPLHLQPQPLKVLCLLVRRAACSLQERNCNTSFGVEIRSSILNRGLTFAFARFEPC